MRLTILHQDEHLVAIDKPPGLLTHRSFLDFHETRFAVQLLRDQLGRKVWPVHRLDKGTSGILLFAFSPEDCRALGEAFARQDAEKTYLAVVRGHPEESGEIDHPLSRQDDGDDGPPELGRNAEHGQAASASQDAVTRYRRLAAIELPIAVDRYPTSRYALVALAPLTGRRHQLRRHMKHIAHPIIGDSRYGKGRHNRMIQEHFGAHRLLLHCVETRFIHPFSGHPLVLRAPLSGDFAALVARWGWNDALPEAWHPPRTEG
ncbi:pseudouridine synthase [Oryzomicrobium sp.]|uniref:pseudouridine synthase n=1 Tax=Oryzomicrobium sp. TaxID=1911578 RepID=UPI002FE34EE3